jgi:hypothetical protein
MIFSALGIVGNLVQLILIINSVLLLNFAVLAVPLYFIWRDFRATLQRFRIVLNPAELSSEKEQNYLDAAQAVFARDPEVRVFIYGHTHKPSLRVFDNRAVINTGTWLKRFSHERPRFGYLPAIYVPFFSLNYFRLQAASGRIFIDYRQIHKDPPPDLDLLQRLLVSRKRPPETAPIPERTVLDV